MHDNHEPHNTMLFTFIVYFISITSLGSDGTAAFDNPKDISNDGGRSFEDKIDRDRRGRY